MSNSAAETNSSARRGSVHFFETISNKRLRVVFSTIETTYYFQIVSTETFYFLFPTIRTLGNRTEMGPKTGISQLQSAVLGDSQIRWSRGIQVQCSRAVAQHDESLVGTSCETACFSRTEACPSRSLSGERTAVDLTWLNQHQRYQSSKSHPA